MRHKKNERHFLAYTLDHLVGVFVLLFIAVASSIVVRAVNIERGDSLALVVASSPVTFGVEELSTSCIDNTTVAKYHFTITPTKGGYVELSTNSGPDYVDETNGLGFDRVLSVGSYTWKGSPKPGYVGTNTGGIVVSDVCAGLSTVEKVTTSTVNAVVTSSPLPVSFSVKPSSEIDCKSGTPLTHVLFSSTLENSGNFTVTSADKKYEFAPSDQLLSNGTYNWSALASDGFIPAGETSGAFELRATCPTVLESSTIDNILLGNSSIHSTPEIKLFVDNKPVTDSKSTFNTEEVEIRVTTNLSASVEIALSNTTGIETVLGNASPDDFLSKPGMDVWSFEWNTGKVSNGSYKILARVKFNDGNVLKSEQIAVTISHDLLKNNQTGEPIQQLVPVVSQEERNAILTRVSDPASCGNAEECRIYCKSNNGIGAACRLFTQKEIPQVESRSSLADGISTERLAIMLSDSSKRSKEIPESIQEPEDFRMYCSEIAHADLCAKVLVRGDLAASEDLLLKKEALIKEKDIEQQFFESRVGARIYIDTDNDGVSDFDEVNIYQTDPNNSDSDNDGFQDGAELLARTNPRGGLKDTASSTESTGHDELVVFENPTITGEVNTNLLSVKTVSVVGIAQNDNGTTTVQKLKFEGIAPANSFVTLYIFSDPIVVTVKADAMGSWVYTFDKSLPDGSHQVISTITNTEGHILAKSEPLPFVKTAAAVSFGSSALLAENSRTGFFSGSALYALLAMVIGVLGIALSVVGLVVRRDERQGPRIDLNKK